MNRIDRKRRVENGVTDGSCRINRLLFADGLVLMKRSRFNGEGQKSLTTMWQAAIEITCQDHSTTAWVTRCQAKFLTSAKFLTYIVCQLFCFSE